MNFLKFRKVEARDENIYLGVNVSNIPLCHIITSGIGRFVKIETSKVHSMKDQG